MQPIVTLITPCYNREEIIKETADSIFSQSSDNWEWIIVDDGSTDNSWHVLTNIAQKDSRVSIYERGDTGTKGGNSSRNIGVKEAKGKYCIFIDSDDLLGVDCVKNRVAYMEGKPDLDFAVFPSLLFKKEKNDLNFLWNIESDEDELNRFLRGDTTFQGAGPIWKTSSIREIGGWAEGIRLWQDIDLHVRAILHPMRYQKLFKKTPDVFLRVSDDSLSRVGFNNPEKLKSRVEIFRKLSNLILQKGQVDRCKDGLRIMAVDVILSTVHGKMYKHFDELVAYALETNIFSLDDVKKLNHYKAAYKAKLYRVPFLLKIFRARVDDLVPVYSKTIGTIKYEQP